MDTHDHNSWTKTSKTSGQHSHFQGSIVPAYGGHIVRSTGRKDRHSKVVTGRGVRDRRLRLSAHTAIQFYDVQDRLGYDRPSKAVDWLMEHAKTAIDQLAELPRQPVHPTQYNAEVNDADVDSFRFSEHTVVPSSSTYQNCIPGLMVQNLRLSLQSMQYEPSSIAQAFFGSETKDSGTEFVNNVAQSLYDQREPLQSIYAPKFCDSSLIPIARNFGHNYELHSFPIPARFHGEEDGMPDSPSS